MAPKVCVPADFGRHHIGVPSHGNLTFNLTEGVQIKANSIILSLNSPVIDDLTTNLQLTSLEAEDFTRDAVDCFIEASYTGEVRVETLNKANFRDVNKMSHVFQVGWLSSKCKDFFFSSVDTLNDKSEFDEILFAVEEAIYFQSFVKRNNFLQLIFKKMSGISTFKKEAFIRKLLPDLSDSPHYKIDFCIKLSKSVNVNVLVEILSSHIARNCNKSLDENSRYLLQSINMQRCFSTKPDLGEQLLNIFEKLEGVTKDDFLLFVNLYKQKCDQRTCSTIFDLTPSVFPLKQKATLKEKLDTILENSTLGKAIDSLYSMFEFVWCYAYENSNDKTYSVEFVLDKFVEMKQKQNWSKLGINYLNKIRAPNEVIKELLQHVKSNEKIASYSINVESTVICEYSSSDFVEQIFYCDNEFEFKLPGTDINSRLSVFSMSGYEGMIPDSFCMKLHVTDCSQKQSKDLKLHMVLEWCSNTSGFPNWTILPSKWSGKPYYDASRECWVWGYLTFYTSDRSTMKKGADYKEKTQWFRYNLGINSRDRCRLTVYNFGVKEIST